MSAADETYVKLLGGLRGRTRWILGLLAALAFTAMLMAFNRIDRIYQQNDARNAFLRSDARDGYAVEARAAYLAAASRREKDDPARGLKLVALDSMPGVRWDVHLAVNAAMPPERYRFGGFDVSLVVFAMAAIALPSVLLLLLIGTFHQLAQLHRRLEPEAGPGTEVQQRLNSLWFDRVTERYLEGWRRHAWLGGSVVLVLAVLPGIFLGVRAEFRLLPYVAVNAAGRLFPPSLDPNQALIAPMTGQRGAAAMFLMLPNLALWGVLMWMALRRVPVRSAVPAGREEERT